MATSRYPRPGHRLAPATLRELLSAPVPTKYLKRKQQAGLRLCDLDETAWGQFGGEVCRQLAEEVIRAVGRGLRTATPIKNRRLPAIPHGWTLADLDLEMRTVNCLVSAGIHERPQDFRSMTIGGALGLRGFWAKSLVDLLCSLEYVADHPEARKALRADAVTAVEPLQPAHRYPRPNHRLAPQTLKEVLLGRIPPGLVRGTRLRKARLCDLDETAWDHLSPARIHRLAGLIVSRAGAAAHNPTVMQRPLPKVPARTRLEELRLENRTYNCLRRAGYGRRPADLGRLTVAELLSIRAFGTKCLVDLLSALETRVAQEGRLDGRLTAEAKALGKMPEAQDIRFNDPRLGGLLRAMDTESNTVAELVERIVHRTLDPPDPFRLREQIAQLRDRIQQLRNLALDKELVQVFASASNPRDRQIVAEYYGWDGGGGRTLEEVGRKHGLSRERIRQICARAIRQNRGTAVFAPVLDRALALLAARLPVSLDELQSRFDATGLSACRLPVESVEQAANFLARPPAFEVVEAAGRALAVHPKQAEMLRRIVQAAKRVAANYGVAEITDVMSKLAARRSEGHVRCPSGWAAAKVSPTTVRQTLQTQAHLRWLDANRTWFRLDPLPHYGLRNLIEKVLSVADQIEISKLRAAVARYRRSGRAPPPRKILLEFCRQMPGTRVRNNVVLSDPPRPWRKVLGGVERSMVEVLDKHGPVMERTALEQRCVCKGINRFSFSAVVMSSPVIAQYGPRVYGLPGLAISRRKIRELARPTPAAAPRRVLEAFGRTADGRPYLAYRLSKAAIAGGVVTVPAAMTRQLRGKFTLRTDRGHDAGTLVAKRGCGWGLGPALRRGDAKQGDHMLLLFDPPNRQVRIHLGDEKVLQRATAERPTSTRRRRHTGGK